MNNKTVNKVVNWTKGYVIVEIEGLFLEKFTNFCINNNTNFWNLIKINNTKIRLATTTKDFKLTCLFGRKEIKVYDNIRFC